MNNSTANNLPAAYHLTWQHLFDHMTKALAATQKQVRQLQKRVQELEQIERELSTSRIQFQTIYETANVLILAHDRDFRVIYMNSYACQVLGYEKGELDGKHLEPLYDHQEAIRGTAVREQVLQNPGASVEGFEQHLMRRDGKHVLINWNICALQDADGNAVGVLGIGQDITERKQAEQELEAHRTHLEELVQARTAELEQEIAERERVERALRESEEKYRNVSERASDGILIIQDYLIQYANPQLAKLLGYSVAEMTGQSFTHLLAPEQQPLIQERYKRRLRGDKIPSRYETIARHRNGHPIHIEINAGIMDYQGQPATLAMVRDITERKRMEEALRSALQLNQMVESFSADEIIQFGLEEGVRLTESEIGFFHFVNPDQETLHLVTWSANTLRVCTVPEKATHYPISQAGVWVDCIHQRQAVIHNDYASLPHKRGLPNGHVPIAREMVVPIFEQEKVIAVLGVGNKHQDYTSFDLDQLSLLARHIWSIVQRKQAAQESQAARKMAERARHKAEMANQAKAIFLANISHELRTPLNAILGFAELMTYDENLSPEQQERLSIIRHSGQNLLALINEMLSSSQADEFAVKENDLDLYRLLDDLQNMFHLRAAEKGLRIHCEHTKAPQYIRTDVNKLRQILIPLINTMLKQADRGSITLHVRTQAAQKPLSPGDALNLVFEIQHTGTGPTPDEQKGLPAELPINRQLVHLLGGDIAIQSTPEQKTTIQLSIPTRVSQPSTDDTTLPPRAVGLQPGQSPPDGGSHRLLVADDHEPSRKLLVDLLSNLGFELKEAGNGQEALEIWQTWHPHLIWMDIRMPVMNGYQATQHIQSATADRKTVIVALTASSSTQFHKSILKQGFDSVLCKPFRQEQIVRTLQKHLGLQFVYDHSASSLAEKEVPAETAVLSQQEIAAKLAAMPDSWISSIREALILGEWTHILQLTNTLPDPDLAQTLSTLAYHFDYDAILELIGPR